LLKFLPVEWKFLLFWRELVVPVLESVWSLFLNILGELFETFNLDELLHGVPNKIGKPLFEWVQDVGSGWAVQEEVHLLVSVLNSKDTLLHESEAHLRSEDWLVSLEKTSGYPLVNGHSDHFSESKDSWLFFLEGFRLIDGLEEEGGEGLKRVLVHVVDDAKLNKQEVEHGTLSSDSSVDLSGEVDLDFSLLCDSLGDLDLVRCLLGDFEGLNKSEVLKNGGWIGIRQVLEKIGLKLGQGDLVLILLVDQFFFGLFEIWLLDSDDHCQELILKTGLSDDEVDDCALSSGFWLVMRVDKLGLKIEFE